MADLKAWDIAYASEKLRQSRYSFSDQEVKQYFREDDVLGGMFRVVEAIYKIRVREPKAGSMPRRLAALATPDRKTGSWNITPRSTAGWRIR